ncbi:carbon-nitrogen hydrolase [Xylariaceae sp. FL1272]|nr:carbon-nitrogen hydrolase [Xylariaceae sp. FL1272]
MLNKKIRAATVHSAPVYRDKSATLTKVINLINQAATDSIELLAFPEVFVPGYPYFINAYPPTTSAGAVALYAAQSVVVTEDLAGVQAACAERGVTVVLGVSERMRGGYTLFNSVVTIDADGTILGVHRKLQPTFAERFVWAQGSGHTLRTYETKAGYRIGALACWEHTLNGARQALIDQGQHIHVGCWPALDIMPGFEDVASSQIEALMKTHALTAQVFVLNACNYVDESCLTWLRDTVGPQDQMKTTGGGWPLECHLTPVLHHHRGTALWLRRAPSSSRD